MEANWLALVLDDNSALFHSSKYGHFWPEEKQDTDIQTFKLEENNSHKPICDIVTSVSITYTCLSMRDTQVNVDTHKPLLIPRQGNSHCYNS